ERLGRGRVAGAGPARAERTREILAGRIARTREGEHRLAMRDGDLADDVRGGTEAPDAQAPGPRGAGLPPGPEPDQPGAQQRRGVRVVDGLGQREAVALIGDAVLREAAIAVVAGEHRRVA